MTEKDLETRAARGDRQKFEDALAKVPNVEPEAFDGLLPVNRSMPASTVIPVLTYDDVRETVEWLCRVFGFAERLQIGDHRSQLTFGDGAVVVTDGGAVGGRSVMVRVADVDAHCERVRAAGATIVSPPADYPYGERQYSVADLGGYVWTFSQTIADVDPRDWGGVPGRDLPV